MASHEETLTLCGALKEFRWFVTIFIGSFSIVSLVRVFVHGQSFAAPPEALIESI